MEERAPVVLDRQPPHIDAIDDLINRLTLVSQGQDIDFVPGVGQSLGLTSATWILRIIIMTDYTYSANRSAPLWLNDLLPLQFTYLLSFYPVPDLPSCTRLL